MIECKRVLSVLALKGRATKYIINKEHFSSIYHACIKSNLNFGGNLSKDASTAYQNKLKT